jgi:hypothetical protein
MSIVLLWFPDQQFQTSQIPPPPPQRASNVAPTRESYKYCSKVPVIHSSNMLTLTYGQAMGVPWWSPG